MQPRCRPRPLEDVDSTCEVRIGMFSASALTIFILNRTWGYQFLDPVALNEALEVCYDDAVCHINLSPNESLRRHHSSKGQRLRPGVYCTYIVSICLHPHPHPRLVALRCSTLIWNFNIWRERWRGSTLRFSQACPPRPLALELPAVRVSLGLLAEFG